MMPESTTAHPEAIEAAAPARAIQVAVVHLLHHLSNGHYRFTTPTPLTHQRVLDRRAGQVLPAVKGSAIHHPDLRDVLGWNLPFDTRSLDPVDLKLMTDADALIEGTPPTASRATLRISSLGDDLFVHSAFPTLQSDAVFFGPDTYRFARFVTQAVQSTAVFNATRPPVRVLDIGCGTGAGGVTAIRALGSNAVLTLNDINPKALAYAAANMAAAGLSCQWLSGDFMTTVVGEYDLIIANPPYLDDEKHRAYRDGGERLGRDLSLRMATTALEHLAPGGQLLLYTGVAIVGGQDPFLAELQTLLNDFDGIWHYSEIDPDVFGEELERAVYADIDRIAAVGLVATRHGAI